jgi:hypothetical protein
MCGIPMGQFPPVSSLLGSTKEFGRVNKHVEFIGQFKEVPWGWEHSPFVHFILYYFPPFGDILSISPVSKLKNAPGG